MIVLDKERCFIDYVHPAVARRLIKDKLAMIYSKDPFVIQMVSKIDIHQLRAIYNIKGK